MLTSELEGMVVPPNYHIFHTASLLRFLEPSGASWNLLEPPGASWSLLELPGAFWSLLEPFGASYGASWSLPSRLAAVAVAVAAVAVAASPNLSCPPKPDQIGWTCSKLPCCRGRDCRESPRLKPYIPYRLHRRLNTKAWLPFRRANVPVVARRPSPPPPTPHRHGPHRTEQRKVL